MKQCEYCAKELGSYHLQYCENTDCEEKALAFYEKRRNTEKIFGVINVICVVAIMAGLFTDLFNPSIGNIIASAGLAVMAVLVFILPYAPENFYQKYRIKKTTLLVRVFSVLLLLAAVVFAVIAFIFSR